MDNFETLGVSKQLLLALAKLNIETPTPIQVQSIPLALKGADILGSAQTGTGKTLAFGIPVIEKLLDDPYACALILTPTRELAVQVLKSLEALIEKADRINTALLIGGDSMPKQLNQLKLFPRLIVGTPGRINDHLERKTLTLRDTEILVLDETDRMLDMGFGPQLETIAAQIGENIQTLMFSATMPKNIMKLAGKYLRQPVRIEVGDSNVPMDKITQETIHLKDPEKFEMLKSRLVDNSLSAIIFVKTKWGADKLATRLKLEGIDADCLHGDLKQSQRDRVTQAFRDFRVRALVATDVAARGLDIPHIELVINYDLPVNPEDYIHRIGRTARNGKEGTAINFVNGEDKHKMKLIERLISPENADMEMTPHREHKLKSGAKPFRQRKREKRQERTARDMSKRAA
jgi:ATP-dependent RNA helicase DeaD